MLNPPRSTANVDPSVKLNIVPLGRFRGFQLIGPQRETTKEVLMHIIVKNIT